MKHLLTDTEVRKAKSDGKPLTKMHDGEGLYLYIKKNQGGDVRAWRFRYKFHGKDRLLALGNYPTVGLVSARDKAEDARKLLDQGLDPVREKQKKKDQAIKDAASLFGEAATRWYEERHPDWSVSHARRIKRILRREFKELEKRPISDIGRREIRKVIGKAQGVSDRWAAIVKQTLTKVLKYAAQPKVNLIDSFPDSLRVALLDIELEPRKAEHHPKFKKEQVPEFMKKVDSVGATEEAKLALKLLLLTAVRKMELLGSKWTEFDFDKNEWHIPAGRMKMGRDHIVPLSRQAVELLRQLQKLTGENVYLFPNNRTKGKHVCDSILNAILARMEAGVPPHGFRGSFSTIMNEKGFNSHWVEAQLGHAKSDQVEKAYNAATYLEQRRHMVQVWADFVYGSESAETSNVISLAANA